MREYRRLSTLLMFARLLILQAAGLVGYPETTKNDGRIDTVLQSHHLNWFSRLQMLTAPLTSEAGMSTCPQE